MRRKRSEGFTLVEVIVVVAIIGVISAFAVPKVRDQMAKSKDAKAVVLLSRLRMASEMYFAEKGEALGSGSISVITSEELKKLLEYLDDNTKKSIGSDGEVEVGGHTDDTEVSYGGKVKFTFKNPESAEAEEKGDGIYIWIDSTGIGSKSTNGTLWKDY